jgi:hypothetical protein
MDFIKVKNKHILFEYTDMSDSVFRAWQKVMALTAFMESMPTREQMLVHVHHATLKSLDEVLMKHGCSLDEVLMKVLCDADDVKMKRDTWKRKQKEKRARLQNVSGDVPGDVSPKRREEKRREEKNKEKKEKYADEFESFYTAYPKHVGKKAAFAEWNKAKRAGVLPAMESVLSAIENQKRAKQQAIDTGQFAPEWPDPERWIKRARWEDEVEENDPWKKLLSPDS